MAIARFPSIVIDCPDPGELARFYGTMLDWKADVSADDLDAAGPAVLALGATKHDHQPGSTFRVCVS